MHTSLTPSSQPSGLSQIFPDTLNCLGNITVFDGGNGGTSNFLNTLVKTVAPSLGVLDKLPIGETVKGIINPESKTEEKPATKTEEKKDKK